MANPLQILKLKPVHFQFIQEVQINASPAKTWKAILNTPSWWHYEPTKMKTSPIKPRAGAILTGTSPTGESLYGTVTHVEPGKLLRFSGPLGTSHLPFQSVYIFELQPKGKGTLLRLGHRGFGFADPDIAKRFKNGWPTFLKQLKALAEK